MEIQQVEHQGVRGYCRPGYESMADTFAELFSSEGEEGAALAVYRDGELQLSLWGGTRDKAGTQSWEEHTQVNAFSASKGLVALCALQLVAEGKLALDRPVADYWPEFAAEGKDTIVVRDILCHRSGLSAFSQPIADTAIYDWRQITDYIAREKPWWRPGSAQGYSPMIYGWIIGELVRRVANVDSFDDYFQAQVAVPLGVACSFGVAESRLSELADVGPLKRINAKSGANDLGRLMKSDPAGVVNRAFTNPMSLMMGTNSPQWRQAQIPAANGHTSARALAAVYGALANRGALCNGHTLLPEDFVSACWQEQSAAEQDRVLGAPLRFSLGFMLSSGREDCRFGRGERGFGHPGAGGCLGFADPDYGIGFGYVTHRMGQSLLVDLRAKKLVDALYEIRGI